MRGAWDCAWSRAPPSARSASSVSWPSGASRATTPAARHRGRRPARGQPRASRASASRGRRRARARRAPVELAALRRARACVAAGRPADPRRDPSLARGDRGAGRVPRQRHRISRKPARHAVRNGSPPPRSSRIVSASLAEWLDAEGSRELTAEQKAAVALARIVEIRPFDRRQRPRLATRGRAPDRARGGRPADPRRGRRGRAFGALRAAFLSIRARSSRSRRSRPAARST